MLYHSSGKYEMNSKKSNQKSYPKLYPNSTPNATNPLVVRSRDNNDVMCSQQSVFTAMDRFVKAVNNMQSTVLVPSRLLDIEVSDASNEMSQRLSENFDGTDLHSFFTLSKDVQNELLWGPTAETPAPSRSSSGRSSPDSLRVMKYFRQFSDNSWKSDSDVDSVFADQDIADEQSSNSPANNMASAFRYHLLGLHTILHELADSADFLSSRYQDEIESPST